MLRRGLGVGLGRSAVRALTTSPAMAASDSLFTKALMVPPDHFAVEYKINSWMGGTVDKAKAREEWDGLKRALENYGVTVETLAQKEGLPDMVFVCNSGLAVDGKVFLASFRHKERQAERAEYEAWYKARGWDLVGDGAQFFEGGGDAVFSDAKTLWAGHGPRSQPEVYDAIHKAFPHITIHRIPLSHPDFYHLDTCFFPVGAETAVVYPAAFSAESLALMGSKLRLVEVSKAEAERFACNGLSVGPRQVILPAGCEETAQQLRDLGAHVTLCPMGEFMKSGGACQCLVMKLW